ncbi:MAG: F0F1 ATP synthase subunit A, partial [Clostridia bacterium]|nr:F0F1 ATP synthase subunit A [Clostridia bacterium]
KAKSRSFAALDILYILMMILPFVFSIVLKILTKGASEGISITGAQVFFTLKTPIQPLPVTESQVNSLMVLIALTGLCLYLTHGLRTREISRRQILAEWIVEKVDGLVKDSMGEYFMGFVPFIIAILGLSGFSSLMSLLGLFPPTSDINIVGGWAVLVFILITYYKMKCGPIKYITSFGDPVPLLAPLNIISEVATPLSMAFRHYGNVLSGSVISVLVATGLQGLSRIVLGWLPGFLGEFPFLQIGLPAILSAYFDVFSGLLQAYIFAMLTMMYVSAAFPMEDYFARREKKEKQKT